MNLTRRWKPFWRWEAFLFAMVLVLAIAANFVTRANWPVAGPILAIVLLVLAVAIAVLLVLPLFRRNGRDSENTRKSLEGVELLEVEPTKTLRVVESERRQNAIDAAHAKTTGPLTAVLTPDASRWLGRELRVAVDLIGGDGQIYRAGFVPPEVDPELSAELRTLAARRAAVVVPVTINGSGRPFTVDFGLGAIPA
ncbi:hypothetical protein ACEXOS_007740 [Herbiconiux sp. P16]|uniref:hypothetical protein n=1 Tax=Herbiconiux wuyangfengii TaxID=3342794 RepID=UPI0035B757BB